MENEFSNPNPQGRRTSTSLKLQWKINSPTLTQWQITPRCCKFILMCILLGGKLLLKVRKSGRHSNRYLDRYLNLARLSVFASRPSKCWFGLFVLVQRGWPGGDRVVTISRVLIRSCQNHQGVQPQVAPWNWKADLCFNRYPNRYLNHAKLSNLRPQVCCGSLGSLGYHKLVRFCTCS